MTAPDDYGRVIGSARKRQTERTELAADGGEREALGGLIWTTSRNDESTISAAGANIVADAILAAGWRRTAIKAELEAVADQVDSMESFAHGQNETSKTFLIGYGTAKRRAARIIRDYTAALSAPVPDDDPWCRREDCTWRHWRSGSMPTHRRGEDCPPPAAPVPDVAAERVAAMLTFADFDALQDHLQDLNSAGIDPEVVGYDRIDRPIVAWLIESGGDDTWPLGLTLGGEDAVRPGPMPSDLIELAYPVRVAPHPRAAALTTEAEGTCSTPGCEGDVRYAAPGRGHREGCRYPLDDLPRTTTEQPDDRSE